jgi:hypothetical protein
MFDPNGKMFCYMWSKVNQPSMIKFGETWVKIGEDPEKRVWERIKKSLGVEGDLVNLGQIILEKYWDVTEFAKSRNRCYPHGKVDDLLRLHIGHRRSGRAEFHAVSADEAITAINKALARLGQPLPSVGLSAWQHDAALDVISAITNNKTVTMAELCARFGKTIWAGAISAETAAPLTIVASYVLTSFASFAKDLTGFQQFRNMSIIDCADPDYQDLIDDSLARGRQVVVFLSMVGGRKRQDRIDYLFGLRVPRLVFIDEADFGAHTKKQTTPFIESCQPTDRVVLMTGTNGERACGEWKIDHYLGMTYAELLVERKEVLLSPPGTTNPPSQLKLFAIDRNRSRLVVPAEFYQMDVQAAVDQARRTDPTLFVDGDDHLPSWTKFAADPLRAKGFWTKMLEAMFLGQNNMPHLDIDRQTKEVNGDHRVAMMFLSSKMENKNLEIVTQLTRQTLKGWRILEISGGSTYNGKKITNRNAEPITREVIKECRRTDTPLLILSKGMAQRSYSISDVATLFLCYDGGDAGATTQKISRALTPDSANKIGRVFSLSFDPNRDDKFDAMMIAAAHNIAKRRNIDMDVALRKVLDTIDIFSCGINGRSLINSDTYLDQLLERKSLSRVVGQQADTKLLSSDEIRSLAAGKGDYDRLDKVKTSDKGKTGLPRSKTDGVDGSGFESDKGGKTLLKKARETLINIVENLPFIAVMTGRDDIRDSLIICEANADHRGYVRDEFGISPINILALFDRGVLNYDLATLQKSVKLRYLMPAKD